MMKIPVIEFKDYSFKYHSQSDYTLHDINLTIYKGEKILIIGPSGSGKSTLGNCINGLIPNSYKGDVKGDLIIVGKNTKDSSIFDISKEVGTVLQDSDGQFVGLSVGEDIAFALENDNVEQEEMKNRVYKISELVNMKDLINNNPYELSGGQKQRVAIARALVLNPKILLCDEATSALDPQITRDILNLLLKINKEMNITIVVVTHQMEVIKQICNKVTFLKDGRVLSVGKPEELFVAPNQEIQKFVGDDIEILPQTGKNIKLFFTNNNSKSHTITQLARTLDINFDICQGKLENFRGSMMGSLIINIDEKDLQAVENYLDQEKITWEEIV